MILTGLIYSISFISLIIILIDIIPLMKDWALRIHIGRYKDKSQWNKAITQKGLRWLENIPKIKVTDNKRLVIIDMLQGNYTKSTIQYWQEASLILGLSETYKGEKDTKIQNKVLKFLDLKFDSNGQWIEKPENIDAAILAYAIMKLDFIDVCQYRPALDYTWEIIKKHTGADGTVEYRKFMNNYRYVDTIGFICPFLICYGIRFEKEECIDLAVKQIKEYEQYGMLNKHYIPCHVYKIEEKVPLGLYGWGRGLGWFAIGLIDSWNELPRDNEYKNKLEVIIRGFAEASMSFQKKDGSWGWTVTRHESRSDSSATATLAWYLLNAARIEGISKECLVSTEKAISYLMRVTRRDGAVDFSQGDTKDIGIYSTLFNILPFTQGFCIRLISAYLNKNEG